MSKSSKKSIVLMHTWRKTLKGLGPEQAGMVILNLMDVDAGDPPEFKLSPKSEGVFEAFNDIEEEMRENYDDLCEKRREAASKRYQSDDAKDANATNVASVPKAADRIGKDRIGKDIYINNSKSKKRKTKFQNFDEREYSEDEFKQIEEAMKS